jgi:hypothetical protein
MLGWELGDDQRTKFVAGKICHNFHLDDIPQKSF